MKTSLIAGLVASVALTASSMPAKASTYFESINIFGLDVATSGVFEIDSDFNPDGSQNIVNVVGIQTLGASTDSITGLSPYAGADQHYFSGGPPWTTFAGISWATVSLGSFNFFFDGTGHYQLASSENPEGVPDGLHVIDFTHGAPTHPPVLGGVPEPATWAMMLMGFGAAGALLRKRRASLAGTFA